MRFEIARANHRVRAIGVLLTCLTVVALPRMAVASTEDSGAWLSFFANGKLPAPLNDSAGSWRAWMDASLRLGDDAERFSQGVVRAGLGYAVSSSWTVWAGYAYIRTDVPYARTPTDEQRIWEQVIWNGGWRSAKLSSRTRLEQRFFSNGIDTGWRLREFVKWTQPLDTRGRWSWVTSDEIFVNLNEAQLTSTVVAASGWDRNRFFIGPGLTISPSLRAEFGYMNQYTFRPNGPDRNDHLLAVNLFWTF